MLETPTSPGPYVRSPEKVRARWMVRDALKYGKLTRQPCETCGEPQAEAHHDDYSKPLDVRWLCSRCHAAVHWGERSPRNTRRRSMRIVCNHGHQLTPENTYTLWSGKRVCRTCHTERARRDYHARKSTSA